jgi:hypothetical protein
MKHKKNRHENQETWPLIKERIKENSKYESKGPDGSYMGEHTVQIRVSGPTLHYRSLKS